MNHYSKLFLVTGLSLSALLLIGCNTRYEGAQADHSYTAVKVADWQKEAQAGGKGAIRVLFVHGMNEFPFGDNMLSYKPDLLVPGVMSYRGLVSKMMTWPEGSPQWCLMLNAAMKENWGDFISKATAKLGYKEDCSAESATNYEFHWVHVPGNGDPVGFRFTRIFRAEKGGSLLKCYVVNWGLGAALAKESTFGSWAALSGSEHAIQGKVGDFDPTLNGQRVLLNKMLKLYVMDWGLGDAALYLGGAKKSMIAPVEEGLNQMIGESGPDDHIAIVAASLGSTITLDAMEPRLEEGRLRQIALSTETHSLIQSGGILAPAPVEKSRKKASNLVFYMFANQYGLLKIGGNDSLKRMQNAGVFQSLDNNHAAVQIYAFTDPNDLLSYPLNPGIPGISACNVYVNNREIALPLFRDPLEAHVNYELNPSVLQTILNGPKNVHVSGPPAP